MKAAVVLALATAATAAPLINCQVPATYLLSSGGQTCTGPAPGYLVYGVCLTGLDRAAYALTAASEVRVPITTANADAFSGTAPATATGCSVPPYDVAWNMAASPNTVDPITTSNLQCGALAGVFSPASTPFKGIDIRCDRANGYFPVNGVEGTQVCANGRQLVAPFPAPAVPVSDYFFGGSVYQSFDFAQANPNTFAMTTQFTGANALACAQGCVLPATICQNGALNANVIGAGTGFNLATCTLAPTRPGVFDTVFQFRCGTAGAFGNVFTATCTSASTTANIAGYGNQCGAADGAQSAPLYNLDGNLDAWATPITQIAGLIQNYPAVTSVLSIAYPVTAGAYATLRYWNNNPAQALQNGNIYQIVVTGCAALAGNARIQCVQQTLNWWRCYYNFPFYGGSVCYAGAVIIACPTNELGFRCPSSSKKGLLGLLGLLAIIPLLLLCCCLLLLCCIRRRKTEADVHFATFDPHAAPVVATAPCATATACPTGFGTPFTHSGVPVL